MGYQCCSSRCVDSRDKENKVILENLQPLEKKKESFLSNEDNATNPEDK